jgi:hypothetical protein
MKGTITAARIPAGPFNGSLSSVAAQTNRRETRVRNILATSVSSVGHRRSPRPNDLDCSQHRTGKRRMAFAHPTSLKRGVTDYLPGRYACVEHHRPHLAYHCFAWLQPEGLVTGDALVRPSSDGGSSYQEANRPRSREASEITCDQSRQTFVRYRPHAPPGETEHDRSKAQYAPRSNARCGAHEHAGRVH